MNLKFKKNFRPLLLTKRASNILTNRNTLNYGTFGIQSLNYGYLTYNEINSIRIKMSRLLKSNIKIKYKIIIRVFFIHSVTQKPKLSRMGKGSGSIKK
jgi:large subunit ribosomal protein L16